MLAPIDRNSGAIIVSASAANVREGRTAPNTVVVSPRTAQIATQLLRSPATNATPTVTGKASDSVQSPPSTPTADQPYVPNGELDTTDRDSESSLRKTYKVGNTNNGPGTGIGLYGYRWNLPPHKWSLPVEPSSDPLIANTEAYSLGSSPKYRRGRIYWYSRVDSTYVDTSKYNTGKGKFAKDPRYGFQFLWNPETFSTSVAVNMDITPSFADKFVEVVGAFPSGEYLTVSFRIDRTNDFACIRSIPKGASAGEDIYAKYADEYSKYYSGALGFTSQGFDSFETSTGSLGQNVGEKIVELQKYGTIADLEYLYKAINGPGWSNAATGKDTSDIGFLMPTLLRIDIGPLSYLGYVNNMQINHIGFSKGMVPIRTDVSLQFNLMATAGLSSR